LIFKLVKPPLNLPREGRLLKNFKSEAKVSPTGGDLEGALVNYSLIKT